MPVTPACCSGEHFVYPLNNQGITGTACHSCEGMSSLSNRGQESMKIRFIRVIRVASKNDIRNQRPGSVTPAHGTDNTGLSRRKIRWAHFLKPFAESGSFIKFITK